MHATPSYLLHDSDLHESDLRNLNLIYEVKCGFTLNQNGKIATMVAGSADTSLTRARVKAKAEYYERLAACMVDMAHTWVTSPQNIRSQKLITDSVYDSLIRDPQSNIAWIKSRLLGAARTIAVPAEVVYLTSPTLQGFDTKSYGIDAVGLGLRKTRRAAERN